MQARIAQKIAQYLDMLARSETQEPNCDEPSTTQVRAALAELKSRQQVLDRRVETLKQSTEHQTVIGAPEAKLMRMAHGQHAVAHNVQIAVDAKHKLIATHTVTADGFDHQQRYPIASRALGALHTDKLTVVADVGYMHGQQAIQCEQANITPVVPMQASTHTRGPYLPKSRLDYDAQKNTYQCPAGEVLVRIKTDRRQPVDLYGTRACPKGALKSRCTGANYRTINRAFHASHADAG